MRTKEILWLFGESGVAKLLPQGWHSYCAPYAAANRAARQKRPSVQRVGSAVRRVLRRGLGANAAREAEVDEAADEADEAAEAAVEADADDSEERFLRWYAAALREEVWPTRA